MRSRIFRNNTPNKPISEDTQVIFAISGIQCYDNGDIKQIIVQDDKTFLCLLPKDEENFEEFYKLKKDSIVAYATSRPLSTFSEPEYEFIKNEILNKIFEPLELPIKINTVKGEFIVTEIVWDSYGVVEYVMYKDNEGQKRRIVKPENITMDEYKVLLSKLIID